MSLGIHDAILHLLNFHILVGIVFIHIQSSFNILDRLKISPRNRSCIQANSTTRSSTKRKRNDETEMINMEQTTSELKHAMQSECESSSDSHCELGRTSSKQMKVEYA